MPPSVDDILKKYSRKIEREIETEQNVIAPFPVGKMDISREYYQFKQEAMPTLTKYENMCRGASRILHVHAKQSDREKIEKNLRVAHLDIDADDSISLAFSLMLVTFLVSGLICAGLYFITATVPYLMIFLFFFLGLFIFYYYLNAPQRLAQTWRLKASSQMVPCILYIVVYMRHTSNFERAIAFASEHLQAPLALDFKKVFYDVEVGKYSTLKDSLDAYLETWRDYSLEFLEAFHLIESSLFEPSDSRRVAILEKSLEVILDGVYEKMLKFTHSVKAPLTNLYMLGIVLPTLMLALLPLGSTLLQGAIKWYHIAILFNLIVPFLVFYLTSSVLSQRPGGYGETELLEQNPDYPLYASNKPLVIAFFIALPFLIIGLLPFIFHYTALPEMLGIQKDYSFRDMMLLDFKTEGKVTTGPFGVGALLLSLFIPLGLMLLFSIAYKMKTSQLIKTRQETKNLESEFASSLFQLGNRLGDGMPAELAFGKVAETLRGTPTESFFRIVNTNINQLGMSVDSALFDKRRGALIYYPSSLIKTSMKILGESVKKSLQAAARALMSISQYVKNIKKIDERLRDLLAEIVSDMKSNMTFLAPMLAGIVVGLSIMITTILNKLSILTQMPGGTETSFMGLGNIGDITSLFNVNAMIPPYYLQVIVGVYLIEIIFILTQTLVTVESGVDKLSEKSEISKNLRYGIMLYFLISLITTITLSALALVAISGIG